MQRVGGNRWWFKRLDPNPLPKAACVLLSPPAGGGVSCNYPQLTALPSCRPMAAPYRDAGRRPSKPCVRCSPPTATGRTRAVSRATHLAAPPICSCWRATSASTRGRRHSRALGHTETVWQPDEPCRASCVAPRRSRQGSPPAHWGKPTIVPIAEQRRKPTAGCRHGQETREVDGISEGWIRV